MGLPQQNIYDTAYDEREAVAEFENGIVNKLLNDETVTARIGSKIVTYAFEDVVDQCDWEIIHKSLLSVYNDKPATELNKELEMAATEVMNRIKDGVREWEHE